LNRPIRVVDALNQTLLQTYDAGGGLIAATDKRGHATHYAVDAYGQRIGVTNAEGASTAFEFDRLGRVVKTTDPPRLHRTVSVRRQRQRAL